MKFPRFNIITIAVTYCFALYSICGCSGTKQAANPLDKYDGMPYKDIITVHASEEVAYKTALVSLENRGYTVTLSDPQTGFANLELSTSTKLPEEDKLAQMNDSGMSAGTIILLALAIVLIVGIIILIASASNDDSKDEKKNNTGVRQKGRIDSGHPAEAPSPSNIVSYRRNESWHDNQRYIGPFISPFIGTTITEPSPDPSYLYLLTLTTTSLNDSTTEIQLQTTRMDLLGGDITNSERLENKYLNYGVFDGIDTALGGR